jgi:hypothetical protein
VSDAKALAIVPRTLAEVSSLADVLAKSTLLPDALRGKVPDVIVQILAGQELGLSPMASIRGVHIVQGKPVLSADTMVALIHGSGLCEYFSCVEDTDARVTYETKRRGAPNPQRTSWSVEDTKRAGLNTKDNWRLYPRSMMKARCKAILARDVYPDVLAGCYDENEIERPRVEATPWAATPAERAEADREPDAVDAELVANPATEWLDKIKSADSEVNLKALGQEIAASGLTNGARAEVNDAYKARMAELRKAS